MVDRHYDILKNNFRICRKGVGQQKQFTIYACGCGIQKREGIEKVKTLSMSVSATFINQQLIMAYAMMAEDPADVDELMQSAEALGSDVSATLGEIEKVYKGDKEIIDNIRSGLNESDAISAQISQLIRENEIDEAAIMVDEQLTVKLSKKGIWIR